MDSSSQGSAGQQNPFRPPDNTEYSSQSGSPTTIRSGGAYVRQVRMVATLMIVNGALLLIVGLMIVGVGVAMQFAPEFQQEINGMPRWMFAYLLLIGLGLALSAILQIVGGIRNLSFRGRKLGIAALGVGLVSLFSAYCFPTSLALAIYGLIVYLHPEVVLAFRLRSEGNDVEDIYSKLNA